MGGMAGAAPGECGAGRGVAAAALALGVALALVSALSFDWLEPRLDVLAWDGDAEPFTPAFYATLVLRLRLAGALCVGAALAAWCARARVAAAAARGRAALRRGARELAGDAARAWRSTPRAERWAAAALCAGGAALRAAFLLHPLRRDEAFSFNNFIAHPWWVALSNTAPYYGNNNHLLNTALAKLSCAAFGSDPWAIRLPACVAGALLVPAVYAAGRALYGRGAALLAASLVAVSPGLVAGATDARGYAWVTLCAVGCWACAAHALRRPNAALSAIFALLAAAGFYAVPTMLLPFGGLLLWLAANAWRPAAGRARRLASIALATGAAGGLALALYAPVLAVSGLASLTDNHWVQPRPWTRFAAGWAERGPQLLDLLSGDALLPGLGAALAAGAVGATVFHRRIGRQRVSLVGPLLLWCAGFVLAARVVPWTRVWSFALPFFFLVASAGIAAAGARIARGLGARAPALGSAAVLSLTLASLPALLGGDRVYAAADSGRVLPLPEAADFIATRLRPGDRVLAEGAPGLVYELRARGIAPERFLTPAGSERRLLVLADEAGGVSALVAEHDVSERAFRAPRLLARFERYTPLAWYELVRRAPVPR